MKEENNGKEKSNIELQKKLNKLLKDIKEKENINVIAQNELEKIKNENNEKEQTINELKNKLHTVNSSSLKFSKLLIFLKCFFVLKYLAII